MITFACKKVRQDELIRCSFDLNKTDYNTLMFMFKNKRPYTVHEIAKEMSLERTTIQKAIKNLVNKGLVQRMQKNLPKGGYTFLYKVNDKDKIKAKIKKIVYEWYKIVEKEIDKL